MNLIDLIKISRPRFWLYLAGPYLVGLTFGTQNPAALSIPFYLINFLFFLIPANFLLYGINDYFDFETDKHNEKKDQKEHRLKQKEKHLLIGYLLLTLALSFFLIALQSQIEVQLLMSLFLFLSFFYSGPPLRFKGLPLFDFSSNILYAIPALIGYYQSTESFPPLLVVIAIFCWTSAMHLFSAVPDIDPDKKAHLHTSAVVLGKTISLIICFTLWLTSTFILMFLYPSFLSLAALVYPLTALFLLIDKKLKIQKVYWYFPYLNTIFGFLLFLIGLLK